MQREVTNLLQIYLIYDKNPKFDFEETEKFVPYQNLKSNVSQMTRM